MGCPVSTLWIPQNTPSLGTCGEKHALELPASIVAGLEPRRGNRGKGHRNGWWASWVVRPTSWDPTGESALFPLRKGLWGGVWIAQLAHVVPMRNSELVAVYQLNGKSKDLW